MVNQMNIQPQIMGMQTDQQQMNLMAVNQQQQQMAPLVDQQMNQMGGMNQQPRQLQSTSLVACDVEKKKIGKGLFLCQYKCQDCLIGKGRSDVLRAKYSEDGIESAAIDVAAKEVEFSKDVRREVEALKLLSNLESIVKIIALEREHPKCRHV